MQQIKQTYSKGIKLNKEMLEHFNNASEAEILGEKSEKPETLKERKISDAEYIKIGKQIYNDLTK